MDRLRRGRSRIINDRLHKGLRRSSWRWFAKDRKALRPHLLGNVRGPLLRRPLESLHAMKELLAKLLLPLEQILHLLFQCLQLQLLLRLLLLLLLLILHGHVHALSLLNLCGLHGLGKL